MKNNKVVTMAIESSCDETAVAILLNGREVLSNIISSQISIHQPYGGVVPEIASRYHLENINTVIEEALREAQITLEDVDNIGVTYGPGLVGALVIGIATAKAISFAKNIPLIGVHHIQGHICANYISSKELEPPFISLVVSGGHTNIVEVRDYTTFNILGATRDDAIGEAYDKVARVLGLGYPGGPQIDKLAQKGNKSAIPFKRVYLEKDSLDFSFSGLKTAVLNYINTQKQGNNAINIEDVAASFQEAALEVIVNKAVAATKQRGYKKLVMAGGVAANSALRQKLGEKCAQEEIQLFYPPIELCTDNAAMIGAAAYYMIQNGDISNMDLDAVPNLPLQSI